jgi:UDP-N-acetylmuramoyl-tripeptide--D-alanyl-D-alanine ligase
MELAIKNFAAMPFGNKVLILGDMFELGKYAHEEHQNLVEYCVKLGLNNVYLCGDLFKQTQHGFISFSNTSDLKNYLAKEKILDANIFIKGSRSMKLETLLDVIE